ncbi:MAG: S9 family peptidase [Gemmatimonadota bacterium]
MTTPLSMRLFVLCIASFLFLGGGSMPGSAQDAAPRPMTTDDVLNLVRVSDALISPDGTWVLYSRSTLDWKENKRKTTWWKVSVEGGKPFRFLGEDGGSRPAFSPDGRFLAFARSVEKKAQIFLMPTHGGEAVQLTRHKTAVGAFRWAGDGASIVFSSAEPRSEEEEKEHKKGDDAIFVDEGPNGQTEARWTNLWRVTVPSGDEERLTEGERRVGGFDVSADGLRVAFTARKENRRNQGNLSEIYLLDASTGEIRRLTHNRAPENNLLWAPDGRRLAYMAPSDSTWELRTARLWIMDTETGTHRAVSGAFAGNIRRYVWAPDGKAILFGGLERTNTNLYRLEPASGEVERLTEAVGTLAPSSFSRDRSRFAYVYQDFLTPPDIWVGEVGEREGLKLTDANPWIREEIALARPEVIRWTSRDGTEIEGILFLPPDHDGERLPFLLHIHGGPAGVFTNTFGGRYHVWGGLGYAQLLPNVRGSSGYGDELLRGNMHDIGGGDFEDLMTGVDAVIERGVADPDRMALRGWSYGGILGGWTVTQTDRFRAASLGAMVSDWTSEYGPGFNYDVRRWYIGGTPWENPEGYRTRSALTHVADVVTPTLLLHGIADRTDTEAQSMMFFQALKDQGKETRYIRFPREPHGFREPRHQRTRDVEEIRWIQKYTLGVDWTPWERPGG